MANNNLNRNSIRLLPLDYAVGVLAIFILLCSVFFALRSADGQPFVYISSESGEQIYPLDGAAHTLTIPGPVGNTEVVIQNGSARVLSSPGRQQICVHKGEISQHGEWLICLPNRVFIHIAAEDTDEIDSYSY